MTTMFDAVSVDRIPSDATMVAGYCDGLYETVAALRARFPHATVVTITVLGTPGAQVADCENGDLTPTQAATWAARELDAGRHPTIYCNASTWPAARAACGANAARIMWWVAEYDGIATVPAGAVAKQYQGGMTAPYDVSVVSDGWPHGITGSPTPAATIQEDSMPDPKTYPGLYVRWCYRFLLHREVDPAGYTSDVNALKAGANPETIFVGIQDSAEGQAAIAGERKALGLR